MQRSSVHKDQSSSRRAGLLALLLLVQSLLVACTAMVDDAAPTVGADGARADGKSSRIGSLSPREVVPNVETLTVPLHGDERFFTVELGPSERARQLSLESQLDITLLGAVVREATGFHLGDYRLVVFVRDEEAWSDPERREHPDEVWDEVATSDYGQYDIELDHPVLTNDSVTYGILIDPSETAREQEYSVFFDVLVNEEDGASASPGTVELVVVVDSAAENYGVAAGIRVAVASVETVTDERGMAVLEDVPAGVHRIKLGPDGTGTPASALRSIIMPGNGYRKILGFPVRASDYRAWRVDAE